MDRLELTMRRMGWERNKKTLSVPPRVDDDSLERARNLHLEGKYEEALIFLSGIKNCVEDARCLRIAGLSHLGLGHVDEAVDLFSLSRETTRVELARDEVNLCMALLTGSRFIEAIAAAKRAVELAPTEVGPHINLVSALRRANDEVALENYIRTLSDEFPDVVSSPLFRERLDKDPDFVGLKHRLQIADRSEAQ